MRHLIDVVETTTVVWELLKQKEAHDALVATLKHRIDDHEAERELLSDGSFVRFLFFEEDHPELIPEFVARAYKEFPETAKHMVNAFHDETIDLSTLDCTGNDFEPW